MTLRKPPESSFDSWIEVQIREAKERGLFDQLAGAGKPQANLQDAEDPLWWAKQFLRDAAASFPSERALRGAAEALNADIRRINRTATSGPPTQQALLDVAELLAAWRAGRARAAKVP